MYTVPSKNKIILIALTDKELAIGRLITRLETVNQPGCEISLPAASLLHHLLHLDFLLRLVSRSLVHGSFIDLASRQFH